MTVSKLQCPDARSVDVDFWTSIFSELLSCSHNFFQDNTDRIRFPGRIPFGRALKDRLRQLDTNGGHA
jgi:hypothetical protein